MRRFLPKSLNGFLLLGIGVITVPLLAAIGAAVDYTGAVNRRIHLQAAVDSAAVRGCKDIQTTNVATAKTNMLSTFNGIYKDSATFTSDVTTSVAAGTVKADASTTYKVQLGALVGLSNVPLHAHSECEYANNTYEIAMAIDNSGSMGETAGAKTKIQAARDSAKLLVDALYSGAMSSSRIKMSIVPFNLSVNVGSEYRTASWVDSAAQSSTHWDNFNYQSSPWKPANRFTLFDELSITFGGCFETRPGNFAITDTGVTPSQPDSYFVPQFAPDDPGPASSSSNTYTFRQNGNGSNVSYSYANSYIADRTSGGGGGVCQTDTHSDYQVDKAQTKLCKYKGNPTKDISNSRGPNFMCNGKPIMRMSNDATALKAKIDTMVAAGGTNIFEGFMWAWRTISPNGPFADGRAYGQQPVGQPNNVKVLIILTDGVHDWGDLNNPNKSYFSPAGYAQNTVWDQSTSTFKKVSRFKPLDTSTGPLGDVAMDNRLQAGCTNAKAQGIIVYTIGFAQRESDVNSTLLKNCASNSADTNQPQYYYAANSTDVEKVFKDIANRLSELRLTK